MKRGDWRKNNWVAILVGILLAVISVVALEAIFFHWNKSRYANLLRGRVVYPPALSSRLEADGPHGHPTSFHRLKTVSDPLSSLAHLHFEKLDRSKEILTGFWRDAVRLKQNVSQRSVVKVASTGETVFDVTYSTDEYGRRITPGQEGSGRNKHLLLMGCSFVFGIGVDQEDTLPAKVAQQTRSHRVYNFGLPGSSPAHFLELGAEDEFWDGIKEREGAAAFIFMDDHINRALGTMSVTGNWGQNMPYVVENENGLLEVKGTFQTDRAFTTNLYSWLWQSEIVKAFGINLPWKTTQRDFDFIARIYMQIKALYQQRFPNQKFLVVGYPGAHSFAMPFLKRSFEARGVDYVDNSEFFLEQYTEKPVSIKYDLHPTAEANKIWAPVLAEDLGLKSGTSN